MASGPPLGGSVGGDGSREKNRWSESKVYTRKVHKSSKSNPFTAANPPHSNPSNAAQQPLHPPPTIDNANSTYHQPPPLLQMDLAGDASFDNDDAYSRNHKSYANNKNNQRHQLSNGQQRSVTISLASRPPQEMRELRRRLVAELEQVRALTRKIESSAAHVAAASAPPLSQLSASDPYTPTNTRRTTSEAASVAPFRRQLSVSVPGEPTSEMEALEKEKRTPKANQLYSNSEFLLGKDRLPAVESNKKSKANGGKKQELDHGEVPPQKLYNHVFKSCAALLQRLMKHKFGRVFNAPVDVKGLGLHDYFTIIEHPMDLGTVKSRLNSKCYKHPQEFAEDVRLTFRNAMLYNPKGHDVHIMAEQLLEIFEGKWPGIEAECALVYHNSLPKKVHPPPLPPPIDERTLERSDSTVHPLPESKKQVHTPQSGRVPALKKPKAKDPHKRDMTFEEKQKLSSNLQNLPSEKLDNIVQIIKKRNSSLSQHDDEIEVDIDNVDVETLWELDRFVTNYRKSLSKNKRKMEIASQRRAEQDQNAQARIEEMNLEPVVAEMEKGSQTDGKYFGTSSPVGGEKKDTASASSSSNTSSSGSGSSSSDSESGSSSGYASDAHSPRT